MIPRRKIVRPLFMLVILSAAGFLFINSAFFNVQEIKVRGLHHLTESQVLAMSGLLKGVNIFKVDRKRAVRFLKEDPWISEASVTIELPHRLRVDITERQPVGLVAWGNEWLLVDGEGVVLSSAADPGAFPYPRITGLNPGDYKPGQALKQLPLLAALRVVVEFPLNELGINELHTDKDGVTLYLPGRVPVFLGQASSETPGRLDTLKAILTDLKSKGISLGKVEYIDLRYELKPVVKIRSQGEVPK